MVWYFIFSFLLTKLISCDKAAFQTFFNKKTTDETCYYVLSVESHIQKRDITFKAQKETLLSLTKAQLIDYLDIIITEKATSLSNLEVFLRTIIIYPREQSSTFIINNAERHFLFKWAIKAEQYHRKQTKTSHLYGGIIDYAIYMKDSELREFILNQFDLYTNLKERESFDEHILNIQLSKETVFKFIQDAPRDLIGYWINNLELYLMKEKRIKPAITHEDYYNKSNTREELLKRMFNVLKEHKELLELDDFIRIIHNKNIYYTPVSLTGILEPEMKNITLGCHEYNKKQRRLTKSFRGLTNYLDKLPYDALHNYTKDIISQFPELRNLKLIDDIFQNQKHQNYGQVQDNVMKLKRSDLLLYILNSKTILNQTSKFSEDLNTLFRMKTPDLRMALLAISKESPQLQTTQKMLQIVALNNGSLDKWIEDMPRNILADLAANLTKTYASNGIDDQWYYTNTEEKVKNYIITLAVSHNLTSPRIIEQKILNDRSMYNGMYNYFKAVNKERLFTWIKRFEGYHRNQRGLNGIKGGIPNKNTLEKKYYIGQLIYYIEQYPQFNNPIAFDKFVGMYIVHEFIYKKTHEMLIKNVIAIEAYHQRVNPNLLSDTNMQHYYPNKIAIEDKSLLSFTYYYIFRMMAIYPELNHPHLYDRIVSLDDVSDIIKYTEAIFGEHLLYVAKQVQTYNLIFNKQQPDETDITDYDDNKLRLYIQKKYEENPGLKTDLARLVYGQSDYIYWNYDLFIERQSHKDLLVFANIMEDHSPSNPKVVFDKNVAVVLLKKYLLEKMKKLPELHNQTKFDEVINIIKEDSEVSQSFIDKLNSLPRYKLMQFCLVVFHYHFEHSGLISYNNLPLYIMSATKNELLRYIIKAIYLKYEVKTYNDFMIFSRHLHYDYGEQSILDLAEFR